MRLTPDQNPSPATAPAEGQRVSGLRALQAQELKQVSGGISPVIAIDVQAAVLKTVQGGALPKKK